MVDADALRAGLEEAIQLARNGQISAIAVIAINNGATTPEAGVRNWPSSAGGFQLVGLPQWVRLTLNAATGKIEQVELHARVRP